MRVRQYVWLDEPYGEIGPLRIAKRYDPSGVTEHRSHNASADLDPPYGGSNAFVRRSFLCSVTPLGSWPKPNNECVLLTLAGSQNIEVIMPARICGQKKTR